MVTTDWDVLACGLFFNDLVFSGLPDSGPQPGHEFRTGPYLAVPGGIANASIATARLGLRVAMISDVGDDALGKGSLAGLEAEGVDTSLLRPHEGWQTPLTVILNYAGDRAMVTAETPHPGACVLRQANVPSTHVAIAHLQPFAMPWLSRAARAGATIIGDVGWDESGRWDLSALPDLKHCTSFTPNEDEAMHYTRTDTVEDALEALAKVVPMPVITRGAQGAIAIDGRTGERAEVPAIKGNAVDCAGAGDVFGAGLAAGEFTGWTLEQRLRFAVLMSGLTVRKCGGATTAPNVADMLAWHAGLKRNDPLRSDYAFLSDIATHNAWSRRAS